MAAISLLELDLLLKTRPFVPPSHRLLLEVVYTFFSGLYRVVLVGPFAFHYLKVYAKRSWKDRRWSKILPCTNGLETHCYARGFTTITGQ